MDCNKTVIDFTTFSDAAIADYFIQHAGIPTCGRFYNTQLNRIVIHIPGYVFEKRLPVWKRFLIILLICFGSTFFAVEVKAGSGVLHYTETTVKKHKPKLKWKKRRFKFKMPVIVFPAGTEFETLGYTVSEPQILDPTFPVYDSIFKERLVATEPQKKKMPQPVKQPFSPASAILPATLTSRKKRSKRYK